MKKLTVIALCAALSLPVFAESAADKTAQLENEALAKELTNPATSFATLNFNFDTYTGDNGFQKEVISFQPAFPIKLDDNAVFAIRPMFGMTIAETADGDTETNFNNISGDIMYGKLFSTGFVFLGGMYLSAPTSSADNATDNWVGGPEALVAQLFPWGALGGLVFHATDLNEATNPTNNPLLETDITNIQYIYSVSLGNGYRLSASPTLVYNWNHEEQKNYNANEARLDNAWSIPLGIGLSKTTKFGDTPLSISAELNYYAQKQRETDADFLIKFKISPVVNNPLQSLFN